jgi:DNA-binding FadR family transcriptional regulator
MLKDLETFILRGTRISDQIRDVLKRMILEGELKPGVKLPPEEQIAGQIKVSKVTLREALRHLETEGLIEKRRGVHGGSFVVHPGPEKMGESVINYVRVGMISPEELVDFRLILEPALVALAAERRTDGDLKAIHKVIEEIQEGLRQGRPSRSKALEFHRLIGEACHNRLISMVMEALVRVFREILDKIPMTLADGEEDLVSCERIYDSLVQRKRKKAQDLMVGHFRTLAKIIERHKKDLRKKHVPTPTKKRTPSQAKRMRKYGR